ncbi:kelch-like protein 5 [Drosophila grimshawi]|uniref:Kelch-like protein diablo n=1 Tax=Drosophila grimshawi TaxID=7222 RepID=B4JY16_DROGR|nr:kelch-like protein 5 [Drosophila grimshawi]EDV90578.1 GH14209 [Drosophila grimshawi]
MSSVNGNQEESSTRDSTTGDILDSSVGSHADTLLKRMQHFVDNQQLCDVVLIAGIDGKRVSVHRLVLSASSEYFLAMFAGSLRESKEHEVTLGEVHGDALQLLVQHCYTGSIELHEDNVKMLLATAKMLQLTSAVAACCNFLARQLHPSNCLGFAFLAEQYSCTELLRVAQAYTCQHFMEVCHDQEFFQLNADQLGKLLSDDELNGPTEEDVFHTMMSWVRHDAPTREQHIPELLAKVRLPLLQPLFIVDHVENVCNASNECQQLLFEAFKWHLLPPERRSLIAATERTKPRKHICCGLLAVGGTDESLKGVTTIESYCPHLNKWTTWKQTIEYRCKLGAAVMNNKLILVGGYHERQVLNSVESLDLNTMACVPLNPMRTARCNVSVAVLGGHLYAVGGNGDDGSILKTVERWDPIARTWSYLSSMCTGRTCPGVAVLDLRLYAIGGSLGNRSMESYDPQTNYVSLMSAARSSPGVGLFGRCSYAIGGSLGNRSMESYDPQTNKWSLRAPMNRSNGEVGVTVANGFIYALGGLCDGYHTKTVERYDPTTDTWTVICSLAVERYGIGCALLGDRLIAVGGSNGNSPLNDVEEYDLVRNVWNQLAPMSVPRVRPHVFNIPNIIPPPPAP